MKKNTNLGIISMKILEKIDKNNNISHQANHNLLINKEIGHNNLVYVKTAYKNQVCQ